MIKQAKIMAQDYLNLSSKRFKPDKNQETTILINLTIGKPRHQNL